jgi:hypothetical protein
MAQGTEYTLKVGETAKVKRGFITSYELIYGGMPSDDVYSLVINCTSGHASASHNLYFRRSQREFELLDGRMTVLDISSAEIRFRFDK